MVSIVAWLPLFSESALAPSLRVKMALGALEHGDLQYGTNTLSQNVSEKLPIDSV